MEREDTIKENLAEVKNEIFKLSQKFYTQLAMVKDIEDIRAVKLKGIYINVIIVPVEII